MRGHLVADRAQHQAGEPAEAARTDHQQIGLNLLGEVDPNDVTVGMAVEAVWKHDDEREGSILDIAYFRPKGRT